MSVLIKDMEKPKSCFEIIDGDFEYCPLVNTDDDCVLLLKKGICGATWKEQYSKCPLVEAPEPCEDAVSRTDVIDLYKRGAEIIAKLKGISVEEMPHNGLNSLINLPPVTPKRKWIPCSERLPEVGTYVLISKKALNFRSNLPSVCTAHRSCDPRSGKEEWNDMLFGELDDDDVLAWMLLPEPYAEKMSGGEKE